VVSSIFPVVSCDDLDAARDFYTDLLDLHVEFESGWYTVLRSRNSGSIQLGFVEAGHPSVPAVVSNRAAGVLISVIVEDVDRIHEKALAMRARIVWPLQDESFGQRHFMAADPTGLVVDVITPIRPARSFLRDVAQWRRGNR